jgi:preprotein translocase subunit SecG
MSTVLIIALIAIIVIAIVYILMHKTKPAAELTFVKADVVKVADDAKADVVAVVDDAKAEAEKVV